jgi:hypothetical protein
MDRESDATLDSFAVLRGEAAGSARGIVMTREVGARPFASLAKAPDRVFFVLGQGRSGTAFLASLLDTDPRARVHHEPWPLDRQILGLSRTGRFSTVVDSLLEERFTAQFSERGAVPVYGEVNSYLRYNADWLRDRLSATLLHVVRDGRDFVRSAWIREAQRPAHAQLPIVPDDDDPFASRWGSMSRFERICWIWRHTNEMLAESVPVWMRLEDLLSSYETFRSKLLDPIGLDVSESRWRAEVGRPRNTSRRYVWRKAMRRFVRPEAFRQDTREPLPPWPQWDAQQRDQFWAICGQTMQRFGYERGDL